MPSTTDLTLDTFTEARQILAPVITKTPLVYSRHYTQMTGNQVSISSRKISS